MSLPSQSWRPHYLGLSQSHRALWVLQRLVKDLSSETHAGYRHVVKPWLGPGASYPVFRDVLAESSINDALVCTQSIGSFCLMPGVNSGWDRDPILTGWLPPIAVFHCALVICRRHDCHSQYWCLRSFTWHPWRGISIRTNCCQIVIGGLWYSVTSRGIRCRAAILLPDCRVVSQSCLGDDVSWLYI